MIAASQVTFRRQAIWGNKRPDQKSGWFSQRSDGIRRWHQIQKAKKVPLLTEEEKEQRREAWLAQNEVTTLDKGAGPAFYTTARAAGGAGAWQYPRERITTPIVRIARAKIAYAVLAFVGDYYQLGNMEAMLKWRRYAKSWIFGKDEENDFEDWCDTACLPPSLVRKRVKEIIASTDEELTASLAVCWEETLDALAPRI